MTDKFQSLSGKLQSVKHLFLKDIGYSSTTLATNKRFTIEDDQPRPKPKRKDRLLKAAGCRAKISQSLNLRRFFQVSMREKMRAGKPRWLKMTQKPGIMTRYGIEAMRTMIMSLFPQSDFDDVGLDDSEL